MTAGPRPDSAATALDLDRRWLQIATPQVFKLNFFGVLSPSVASYNRSGYSTGRTFPTATFPKISLNRVFCAAAQAKFFKGLFIHGFPLKGVSEPY